MSNRERNPEDFMRPIIEWEKEVQEHNEEILKSIEYDDDDFEELVAYCFITDKMEWVDEPDESDLKPEYDPDVFGVFTLTHVDQHQVGMEGDSFQGNMYVKVEGKDKLLLIPYSC